ncbi:MAG: hypothetical protein RIC80_13640 [Cyclobacteriaceae bacterium]
MKIAKRIAGFLMGALLILGASAHFFNPETSTGLIPEFLPADLVHWIAGGVELLLGIGVFIPGYRKKALLGITLLMLAFLPIHVIDLLKDNPVIGTKTAAMIRLIVQLVFIYLPWFASRD